MQNLTDIDELIRDIVSSELETCLAPHQDALNRIAELMGVSVPRRLAKGRRVVATRSVKEPKAAVVDASDAEVAGNLLPLEAGFAERVVPEPGPVEQPVWRKPGRPRAAAATVAVEPEVKVEAVKPIIRRKATPLASDALDAIAAARFAEGQRVCFRDGMAFVEAKVVAVDCVTGVLTLERAADCVRMSKPAGEVYAAG